MSQLVNDLLKKHYCQDLSHDELKVQQAECERVIEVTNRKLEKIKEELAGWKANPNVQAVRFS